ncbi:hypothetical protein HDU97_009320 [Phlyctochytrium planicorne]|nr:hypothetical protein HDU97_009320 [Phlyctochytrium planicorne]
MSSSFQSLFGLRPSTRTSLISEDGHTPTDDPPRHQLPHHGQASYGLQHHQPFNPYDPLSRWTPVRVSTSSGSFLVPCPPGSTVSDLIIETNRLIETHAAAGVPQRMIVVVRTREGDICDPLYSVATILLSSSFNPMFPGASSAAGTTELLGLTAVEAEGLPSRIHSVFAGGKADNRTALLRHVPEQEDHPKDSSSLAVTSLAIVPSVVDSHRGGKPGPEQQIQRRKDAKIFVSYCWQNSKDAVGDAANGCCDPRAVRSFLAESGFDDVWLDVERMLSGQDLFEQIANGLMSCNVVVACISDEYAASKNCVRELNFAINVLHIPFISLIVGTGKGWQKTKVGLLVGDQLYIEAQETSTLSEKLNTMLSALDSILEADITAQPVDEPDDIPMEAPGVALAEEELEGTVASPVDTEMEAPPAVTDMQMVYSKVDLSSAHVPANWYKSKRHKLGKLKQGDRLECARWSKSTKSYYFQGLHWEPVVVIDAEEEKEGDEIRRVNVRFEARVFATKRVGQTALVKSHTEWVDEILLRKRTSTGMWIPELQKGDEVEFRVFIHISEEDKNVSEDDSASSQISSNVEVDSYDFWPGYIQDILPDGTPTFRCGVGSWFSPESGTMTGAIHICRPGSLRPGIDQKVNFIKNWIDNGKLFVTKMGAIVRPEHLVESWKNIEAELKDQGLEKVKAVSSQLWKSARFTDFLGMFTVTPCKVFLSHFVDLEMLSAPEQEAVQGDGERKHAASHANVIAHLLRRHRHKVIQSRDVLSKEDFENGNDFVHWKIVQEMAKCKNSRDIILACVSKEYIDSDLHSGEILLAKRLLDLPVFTLVVPGDSSVDEGAVAFTKSQMQRFTSLTVVSDKVVDLTNPSLFIGRCNNLALLIGEAFNNYDQRCQDAEVEEIQNPPSLINRPPDDMFRAQVIECVSITNMEIPVLDDDGNTYLENIAGYVWMPYLKNTAHWSDTVPNRNFVQISLLMDDRVSWIASDGWFNSAISQNRGIAALQVEHQKMWRWDRSLRMPTMRASVRLRDEFVVGDRVEKRMLWNRGRYERFLWWPGVVEKKNKDGTFVIRLNAVTPDEQNVVKILADRRELRNGDDPRAWNWWPLSHIYLTKDTMSHPGVDLALVPYKSGFKASFNSTSRHYKERLSPYGKMWNTVGKFKPNPNEPIPAFADRMKVVLWFEGDPKDEEFAKTIDVRENGYTVEFKADCARRAISAFPLVYPEQTENVYVEVTVVSVGEIDDGQTCVSIGFGARPFPPFFLAGWLPNTVGFHSMMGRRIKDQKAEYLEYSQPYGVGDVIGIYVTCNGRHFFTMNGRLVDSQPDGCAKKSHLVVSADGPAVLKVNCGQDPFLFKGPFPSVDIKGGRGGNAATPDAASS